MTRPDIADRCEAAAGQRDLELVLNALEFYQLAVGEGLSIDNADGHTNDPSDAFCDYFEASGLPDEDGNYDRIPKRIYDRLKQQAEKLAALGNPDVSDVEVEDALKSEGIYVYGPDAERFERMFAVVMRARATLPADHDRARPEGVR